jgi:hypothetical protein
MTAKNNGEYVIKINSINWCFIKDVKKFLPQQLIKLEVVDSMDLAKYLVNLLIADIHNDWTFELFLDRIIKGYVKYQESTSVENIDKFFLHAYDEFNAYRITWHSLLCWLDHEPFKKQKEEYERSQTLELN